MQMMSLMMLMIKKKKRITFTNNLSITWGSTGPTRRWQHLNVSLTQQPCTVKHVVCPRHCQTMPVKTYLRSKTTPDTAYSLIVMATGHSTSKVMVLGVRYLLEIGSNTKSPMFQDILRLYSKKAKIIAQRLPEIIFVKFISSLTFAMLFTMGKHLCHA